MNCLYLFVPLAERERGREKKDTLPWIRMYLILLKNNWIPPKAIKRNELKVHFYFIIIIIFFQFHIHNLFLPKISMNCKLFSGASIENIFIEFLFFNCIFFLFLALCAAFNLIHDRTIFFLLLLYFSLPFQIKGKRWGNEKRNKATSARKDE